MKKLIGIAFLASVLVATPAFAAEVIFPPKESGNVVIGQGQRHRNLYVGGGNVSVHGETGGDLFVGGGSVTIAGAVEEDLFVAGGNISVGGPVGGDMRVAGGNITITAPIAGDLLVGGGTVTITSEQGIGGDLWIGGGSVVLHAPVVGDVKIGGGEVLLNAPMAGTIEVNAERLTIGSGARGARITYHGVHPAVVEEGAQVGTIDFEERAAPTTKSRLGAIVTIGFLVQLLAWIAAASVLYLFAGRALSRSVGLMHVSPWKSLGIGLIGLIVWPIIIILLFVTIIGYYLAFILLALFALTALLSVVVGAVFVGSLLLRLIGRTPLGGEFRVNWLSIVVGAIVLPLLAFIPIVGWIICALVFLIGFGTLLRMGHGVISRQRAFDDIQPTLPIT